MVSYLMEILFLYSTMNPNGPQDDAKDDREASQEDGQVRAEKARVSGLAHTGVSGLDSCPSTTQVRRVLMSIQRVYGERPETLKSPALIP